jgi:23S rRNA pseudouridine1911/1915/1917 synthase
VETLVGPDDVGRRLDVYLAERLGGSSRSRSRELIQRGEVKLNGASARPGVRLRVGDTVSHPASAGAPATAPSARPEPEPIPLTVLHEDADVVVLDKPTGMVVHPSPGHRTGTLVHALLARYPELRVAEGERPGIVHRLDKDTSGLMLVARHEAALRALQEEFRARRARKEYTLLACGALVPPSGVIEGPIGRHPRNRLKMAVIGAGRPASTAYEMMAEAPGYSLARARIHTGRTHQIRVHLASIHRPIAGDALYGGCEAPELARQFLHSSRLGIALPSGEWGEWESPLPSDLSRTLELLGLGEVGARERGV